MQVLAWTRSQARRSHSRDPGLRMPTAGHAHSPARRGGPGGLREEVGGRVFRPVLAPPQASPPPRASPPCARAQTGRRAASTAASTRCASTTSCRTSRPSRRSPRGCRPAASPARCASTACAAPWRRTAWSASATPAGPARCATRRPWTPAWATGQCPESRTEGPRSLPTREAGPEGSGRDGLWSDCAQGLQKCDRTEGPELTRAKCRSHSAASGTACPPPPPCKSEKSPWADAVPWAFTQWARGRRGACSPDPATPVPAPVRDTRCSHSGSHSTASPCVFTQHVHRGPAVCRASCQREGPRVPVLRNLNQPKTAPEARRGVGWLNTQGRDPGHQNCRVL